MASAAPVQCQTPEGEPAGQAGATVPLAKRIPSADVQQKEVALLEGSRVYGKGAGRGAGDSILTQLGTLGRSRDSIPSLELDRNLGAGGGHAENCTVHGCSGVPSWSSTLPSKTALALPPPPRVMPRLSPLLQVTVTGQERGAPRSPDSPGGTHFSTHHRGNAEPPTHLSGGGKTACERAERKGNPQSKQG